MKLLPSLRQKKRYIVFEIISTKKFPKLEVGKNVQKALADFLGQLGTAKAAPMFLSEKFNQHKQMFILKISSKYVDEAKAALTLIKKIKNTPVIIKSLLTTGAIKKANQIITA
jgi:ribonuclease P/MRP protein subunit POP5